MENWLIPAIVAGVVFMMVWILSLKVVPSGESQRKKSLIGNIIEENKEKKEVQHYEEDLKLLKDAQGDRGFLSRLPGISEICDLLVKAGLWKKRSVFLLVSFVLFFLVFWGAGKKIGVYAAFPALLVAYFGPFFYLRRKIDKRNQALLDMFPDAIDLIIRSVRSGHPINTAMRMIAENMEPPVCEEFKQVVDEVSYGRTLTEALRRMSGRLDLPDVDFFVVVLAVQQETGGSLTEVLTNLSNIIRKRKQLRLKIRAMTSEGRATAYILGAIPVVEFLGLYMITPSYLDPFFNTFSGMVLGSIAIALIIASQIVIRRMIDIEI